MAGCYGRRPRIHQVIGEQYNNAFDYDIMDYRKVNAIVDLNMGESTGINTLFTIEDKG